MICQCNHLSQFTISFYTIQHYTTSTFDIHKGDTTEFSTKKWEASIVLYLMIAGVCALIAAMSLAYYWDNYNPGFAYPTVETERAFGYWDPNKVESVLAQIEKEFIRQLTDSGKNGKSDTTAAISKILNSGLVNKLMIENAKESQEEYEVINIRKGKPHAVEILLNQEYEDDDDDITSRTQRHLKKGFIDPQYMPNLVSEPKSRGNSSRKDLENTMAKLKLHLNHLETNSYEKSSVDLFLEKYDEAEKLPQALRARLRLDKRNLKKNDLKSLGLNPSELIAMKINKNGKVVADSSLLTGGRYCNI